MARKFNQRDRQFANALNVAYHTSKVNESLLQGLDCWEVFAVRRLASESRDKQQALDRTLACEARNNQIVDQIREIVMCAKDSGRVLSLRRLQDELRPWAQHNFGDVPAWQPLLGIVEEVGELAHAYLKAAQGIRGTPEEHAASARDAVGDILIYLADFCNREGYDLQECLELAWAEVKSRDWKADSKAGRPSC